MLTLSSKQSEVLADLVILHCNSEKCGFSLSRNRGSSTPIVSLEFAKNRRAILRSTCSKETRGHPPSNKSRGNEMCVCVYNLILSRGLLETLF